MRVCDIYIYIQHVETTEYQIILLFYLEGLNQFVLLGWRGWMLSNTTIHDIPLVFYSGHVWRGCTPRQHVDGSKDDLYDCGSMEMALLC